MITKLEKFGVAVTWLNIRLCDIFNSERTTRHIQVIPHVKYNAFFVGLAISVTWKLIIKTHAEGYLPVLTGLKTLFKPAFHLSLKLSHIRKMHHIALGIKCYFIFSFLCFFGPRNKLTRVPEICDHVNPNQFHFWRLPETDFCMIILKVFILF